MEYLWFSFWTQSFTVVSPETRSIVETSVEYSLSLYMAVWGQMSQIWLRGTGADQKMCPKNHINIHV